MAGSCVRNNPLYRMSFCWNRPAVTSVSSDAWLASRCSWSSSQLTEAFESCPQRAVGSLSWLERGRREHCFVSGKEMPGLKLRGLIRYMGRDRNWAAAATFRLMIV